MPLADTAEARAQLEVLRTTASLPLHGTPTDVAKQLGNVFRPNSPLAVLAEKIPLTPQQVVSHNLALGIM